MALTSPDDYKKRKGVSVSSTSSSSSSGLTSPEDYKSRNMPERIRAAENKQYADAMGPSRLLEISNLEAEREKDRLANETMKSIGMDFASQHGGGPLKLSQEGIKRIAATQPVEPDRPNYIERVREDTKKWPALLRPIGAAIEAVAEAPLMVSARQQLGTASDRDKLYEPSKAAQLAGGALNTIGNITFSGSPMGGIYQGTGQAISRYAPRLDSAADGLKAATGRVAASAIKGVAEGVPTNIAQELIVNPEASGKDLAVAGAVGGAFGLLPAAGRAIAEGVRGARGAAEGAARGALSAVDALDRTSKLPQYSGKLRVDKSLRSSPVEGAVVSELPSSDQKQPWEMTREEFSQIPGTIYEQSDFQKEFGLSAEPPMPSPMEAQSSRLSGEYDKYLLSDPRTFEDGYGIGTEFEVPIPEGEFVTIYRVAPLSEKIILPGKYVSTSKKYVEHHLENHTSGRLIENPELLKGSHILEARVRKNDVVVAAGNELWWAPKDAYQSVLDLAKSKMPSISKVNASSLTEPTVSVERSPDVQPSKYAAERIAKRRNLGFPQPELPTVRRPIMRETAQAGEDGAARAASDADLLGFVPKGDKGRFTHPEDTRTYIRSGAEKEPISFENAVNNFYTNAFDNQQRINQFDKYVESVTGTPLSPEERSYYLALNSRGSDMVSNHILTEQLVNAKGDVIGQSLKDITSQIPRRAYKNFTDYLIAKHAETRMLRDETVYNRKANMTVDKVKQKIADYDRTYPEFAKIADQLYEWNEQLTKSWLVDTGIISPETAKAWKDANPYWVPNKRFFSKLERAGKGLGAKRGYGNLNNPVKKYSPTGSERDIIDPIESMIEYVDRYVKTAKRNEVMQTLIKNIRKDPESFGDFAVELKREKVEPGSLGDDGFDKLIESMDDEFNRTLRKSDIEKDNVISGLIDGERVYLRVNDPALLEALVNITPQARSKVLESARKATNLVKVLTTGINPIFSLTRNIFRDIPTAFIASKTTNNPSRFAWDLLDGVVSTFGNKDLYKRYKAVGGGHSSPVAADRDLLAQSKQSILPQTRRGLGFLPRAKSALENLSNVIESAPRLGEFKRLTEAGGDSYGSRVEGLYEANDITTNFKRHGTVSKEADAIFLYLNAALQGLDKTARIFKDKPGAAVSKSLLAVTLPTIALYALNHGDEAYENLSNYQKDNFFNIPKGDGTFIKIPRPREIGVPFGSAVERALREWVDKDPESFRDFSDTITTAFAPPGVPAKELAEGDFMGAAVSPIRDTIAGPLVDVAANENFAGAPIVPGYLEGASPRNQYDANTSEIGKKIGDILNVSPKQVDHLIRSYTGVVGQLALPASAKGGTVTDMLTKQVTADPVFTTDATRYFYELKDKVDTQYQDFKVTGEPPAGYNDAARKYLDSVAGDMSDITKAIRAVDDMDLSAGEAKRMKRELTELRNTMARTAYKAVAGQQ